MHPLGQVLHVTDGVGLVQRDGGPVLQVHPGDTVVVGAGEKHWHGAAPDRLMTHLAIQEVDPAIGQETLWDKHVSDSEYLTVPAAVRY